LSFPGKRLLKPHTVIMGLAVLLSLYWVLQTVNQILVLRAPCEKVSLSAVGVGIEPLKTEPQKGEFANLASYDLWDIPVSEREAAERRKGGKGSGASASYGQKEFNKIPAIYSLTNEKYRWEFYGVAGAGKKRAVFFNPSQKGSGNSGWRLFVMGEPMDDDLAVKAIGNGRVVVFFSKEQKDFVLELFRVNRR
jgi:hypothetical protein